MTTPTKFVDTRLIAVIGTGQQAELQAIWHHDVFPGVPIVIGGRQAEGSERLAERLAEGGLRVDVGTIPAAVEAADVIVTATSATAPLFAADLVKPGAHVTAVGADAAGKQELDTSLLARANFHRDRRPRAVSGRRRLRHCGQGTGHRGS